MSFPVDTVPENRLPQVSAICSFGMRPHVMTGFLRKLLQQHFADADNIESHQIRQKLQDSGAWGSGPDTGILIESVTRWKPDTTGKRPALIIRQHDWTPSRLWINNEHIGAASLDGSRHFAQMYQGAHTIFAVAGRDGAEVTILAAEVARVIQQWAAIIADSLQLHRFALIKIGEPGLLKEAVDRYACPIPVAYAAQETWTLTPHAPRIKRLQITLSELL